MSVERQNSSLATAHPNSRKSERGGLAAGSLTSDKTYVKLLHGENKILILNSYCSCLHLLNYVKEKLCLGQEDLIDFIDFDGTLKEIPTNTKDYAIKYLSPTNTYVLLKTEIETSGEKRYTPFVNESKLNNSILKSLNNLNAGKKKKTEKKNTSQTSVTSHQTKPTSSTGSLGSKSKSKR